MSREIKFRAWLDTVDDEGNEVKEMIGSDALAFEEYAPVSDLLSNECVMQYTGLHDKNGKEIYEGDLLRYPPKDEWEKTNFVAFEVFFHDNDCADRHIGFQMNRVHCQGSMGGYCLLESFLPRYTKQMEIIGNVYENKDLLEAK